MYERTQWDTLNKSCGVKLLKFRAPKKELNCVIKTNIVKEFKYSFDDFLCISLT